MSTNPTPFLLPCMLAMALVAGAASAAQDTMPPGSEPSMGQASGVHMTHTAKTNVRVSTRGMHTMPATVTSADPKTGIVEVTSEGMTLRVHFPPPSMAELKAGDKIGLTMGYSMSPPGK